MLHFVNERPAPYIPNITMFELFYLSCVGHLGDVVVNEEEVNFTRAAMLNDVINMAKFFLALGVKKGDIILTKIRRPTYLVPVIFFAANCIGAVASYRDDIASDETFKNVLRKFRPAVLFVVEKDEEWIQTMRKDVPELKNVVNVTLPYRKNAFVKTALETAKMGSTSVAEIAANYRGVIPMNLFGFRDLALITFSSGSTSDAKPIRFRNCDIVASAIDSKDAAGVRMHDPKYKRYLISITPEAAYGFLVSYVAPICGGCTLIIVADPRRERTDYYFRKQPNVVFTVPRQLKQLPTLLSKETDLSQLYTLACGGEFFAPEESLKLRDWFDDHNAHEAKICNGYGVGEMAGLFSTAVGNVEYDPYSVGVVPRSVKAMVIDPETYRELGFNKLGILCGCSKHNMDGYYDLPRLQHDSILHTDDGDFFITGDLGRINEFGRTYVEGRGKHFLNDTDKKIYCAHVTTAVSQSPLVREAYVTPGPSAECGLAPYAFVVLRNGVEASDETRQQILADAAAPFMVGQTEHVLNHYETPHRIEFVDELPETDNGKVNIRKLEEMANELGAEEQARYDERMRKAVVH